MDVDSKDMQEQLRKANNNKTLDVKTLLTAMQLCLEFEQALGRRFGYIQVVLEHAIVLCFLPSEGSVFMTGNCVTG